MALTVQTPLAPTEEADSYLSLADWRARADTLGITLPTDDTEAEIRIRAGMLYVDSNQFQGQTVVAFQGTQFPRSGITSYVDGELVEYDNEKIPQQVIDAVLYAAAEDSIYITTTGGQRIQSKKVDVIEKTYFDDGVNAASFKKVPRADVLLSRFIDKTAGKFSNILYQV